MRPLYLFEDASITATRLRRFTSPRGRLILLAAPLLLAGCGLSGTDRESDDSSSTAAQATPAAADNSDTAAFEQIDTPDTEQRPEMQLQVVLDRQGFGPGVVDGKMGLSTTHALQGFQEANGLQVTGELDEATRAALSRWQDVPATRVVRIPASWGSLDYETLPDDPADQAKLKHLGYESLDEKLAERFHTTAEVLRQLNSAAQAAAPATGPSPTATAADEAQHFRAGQAVRVPNVGLDPAAPPSADDADWNDTLVSLGVAGQQPHVGRIVVDKSEGWLKGYDDSGKLVAIFTVTSGSSHDPLPLGRWKILGISHNPPFHYNPDLFWDAKASDEKATLPPGPNGPVGVVWIDLSKEHYGIHGTSEPQTIGRTQSHGCVRLTNWDAARLAQMVSTSTQVEFQA